MAYSLAKPSLISPLGAVSVVVNVPVAWMVLGEKASFRNLCGCVMCVVGGYGIVDVVATNSPEREVCVCVCVRVCVCICAVSVSVWARLNPES